MGAEKIDFNPFDTRREIHVPIMLYLNDRVASGHTVNVSDSGMLAMFDRRLDPWVSGRLSVVTRNCHLSIEVRVVRVDGHLAGMTFVRDSDHATIQQLIEHAGREMAVQAHVPAA